MIGSHEGTNVTYVWTWEEFLNTTTNLVVKISNVSSLNQRTMTHVYTTYGHKRFKGRHSLFVDLLATFIYELVRQGNILEISLLGFFITLILTLFSERKQRSELEGRNSCHNNPRYHYRYNSLRVISKVY